LSQTAQVLSELLFDTSFDEKQFISEREIILHELAEDLDNPDMLVHELLLKNLFKKHPISRPIGGYPKTLNKLTLKQLQTTQLTAYTPQNMILLLIGNLSNNQIKNVLKHFENKPSQQQKHITPKFFSQKTVKQSKKVSKVKQGITQTYLNMGTKTVNAKHEDAPKLDLISMILGGGISSRLFIELREKQALTYDIAAIQRNGLDYGYLYIDCAVKNTNINKTQKLILNELTKLQTEKISEEELERNKKLRHMMFLRGIDSPGGCQYILADMEIQYNHEKALINYLNNIKAVTTTDILNVAQTYLQKDNFTTAILKPK